MRMLKIALVANLPPPYRVPVYRHLAERPDVQLHVLFCCRREPNRSWNVPPLDFDHTFLNERYFTFEGRYIHDNPDVYAHLRRIAPDVVVINGFNPTHLYAWLYALLHRCALVPMTDGTVDSERSLTVLHRIVRYLVYRHAHAYIAASNGGRRLYQRYGVRAGRCYLSRLCADNDAFRLRGPAPPKRYDLLFSGRLEPVKNPLFALEVAAETARLLGRRVSLLVLGSGSLEPLMREAAAGLAELVDTTFAGYAMQEALPAHYQAARLLLMPTSWDPWGVVINEACAAGLPVLVSPAAGAAGELVLDGHNGYVRALRLTPWAACAARLLSEPALYRRMVRAARRMVRPYHHAAAARGFLQACRAAQWNLYGRPRPHGARPRVVVVERQLLHYRVALYEHLRALLAQRGIELTLLTGGGTAAEVKKQDQTSLAWSIAIPTRYFLRERVCWQPFGSYAQDADLVIVMHENKLIYNLWLLSFGRPRRLAFWGHGRNMQSVKPGGWKERFKRWTVNKVDWWFAYTDGSAMLVNAARFPRSRTTVVENAIDTREMRALCNAIGADERRRLRRAAGVGDGPVGLYLGSLYLEKRLDFLLAAGQRIHAALPGFHLLVVGAGPEQGYIEAAAARYPWLHYLGPRQGRAKAEALVMADVMLNPGLVGLGVLDSFVGGAPMFTTDCGLHSPEIAYLVSGENGVITEDEVGIYAREIVETLRDPLRLAFLRRNALASAPRYTVENMAERLCRGIVDCLGTT